jgi:dihydrofolate reductase
MNCIVNASENWGIGRDGRLLVPISGDLRRFRALTTGKTVILGRKTLATFPGGKPLKNRANLILSTDPSLKVEGAVVVRGLAELAAACRGCPPDDLCVIGGASVYELLLPYCNTAYVTRTFLSPPADRFFPNLDAAPGWTMTDASDVREENGVRYQFLEYHCGGALPLPGGDET